MTALTLGPSLTVSGATGGRDIGTEGPLVVLVHGAGMDRAVWSLQTRWLAHHGCPTLAVDLPGHGASSELERSSIEDYADWTAELVEQVKRPVHLVGHSMGSFIVLETTQRTSLDSITLIGTAAAMPLHPALLKAAEANDPLAAQLMSGWAFAPSTRTGPHPSPGGSMVGTTLAMIAQSKPGVLFHDLSMCLAYQSAVETAAKASVPTTFLLGQADRMTPVRTAQPLIDVIENASVEIVPGVGHMVQIESPTVTRATIAGAVARANG
jgi:pimeloyl-ACP methyl ester carboxylesterase